MKRDPNRIYQEHIITVPMHVACAILQGMKFWWPATKPELLVTPDGVAIQVNHFISDSTRTEMNAYARGVFDVMHGRIPLATKTAV